MLVGLYGASLCTGKLRAVLIAIVSQGHAHSRDHTREFELDALSGTPRGGFTIQSQVMAGGDGAMCRGGEGHAIRQRKLVRRSMLWCSR